MGTAIMFTAVAVWAIYERSSGHEISDQVFMAAALIVLHAFRYR